MSKLITTCFLAAVFSALPSLASHAEDNMLHQIGVLIPGTSVSAKSYTSALETGLRELGYIEGKNIHIEFRYADGKEERLVPLATELVNSKINILVTGGDRGAIAAKKASSRVPIVAITCDALAANIVDNLAHPRENLTGITCITADLAAKRVEILKEAVPNLARIAVFLDHDDRRVMAEFAETERAANYLGLSIDPEDVRTNGGFQSAFATIVNHKVDGLIPIFDTVPLSQRKAIAELAIANKMPTMFNFSLFVRAGGLISYGPSLDAMFHDSARHVAKIIEGAQPSDLPIEQPTKYELAVNLDTAAKLGLVLPPMLLSRADLQF